MNFSGEERKKAYFYNHYLINQGTELKFSGKVRKKADPLSYKPRNRAEILW
jgi:hypothetical protein